MYCHCRPLENQRIIQELLIELIDKPFEVLKRDFLMLHKVPAPSFLFSNIRKESPAMILKGISVGRQFKDLSVFSDSYLIGVIAYQLVDALDFKVSRVFHIVPEQVVDEVLGAVSVKIVYRPVLVNVKGFESKGFVSGHISIPKCIEAVIVSADIDNIKFKCLKFLQPLLELLIKFF